MSKDRVLKSDKVVAFPFTALAADTLLSTAAGETEIPVNDVDFSRVVLEVVLDSFSGTNCNFEVVTTNAENTLTVSSAAMVKADGSTAFDTGNLSATGSTVKATGLVAADGSAASNIGKFVGIFYDRNDATVTGTAYLYFS